MEKKVRKPRSAQVLFAKNTPFRPKVVKSKKLYSRKPKHPKGNV